MQRLDMTPDVFQQFLDIVLQWASDADLERIAAELRRRTQASLLWEQRRLLRRYRSQWSQQISDRAAAEEIASDLARAEALGFMHRASPPIGDPRRAAAFEILRSGPALSAERIRKLIAGSPSAYR